MQVRYPGFDLAASKPHWGDNVELVQILNGVGIIPAAVERYLIRVMRMAKQHLDPVADADLIREVDIFNKQEGQHLKLHAAYLNMLRDNGYPEIPTYEAAFQTDLDRFFAEESLSWNLGYCEGFESSGSAMAEPWVDGVLAEQCGGHGSTPMRLWQWHLAEEFEHRTVVHDVLHRLHSPKEAYELQCAGAEFNRSHVAGHAAAAANYLLRVDRGGMSDVEVEQSQDREMQAWLTLAETHGERLSWVFQKDYDPRALPPPLDYEKVLAAYTAPAARGRSLPFIDELAASQGPRMAPASDAG